MKPTVALAFWQVARSTNGRIDTGNVRGRTVPKIFFGHPGTTSDPRLARSGEPYLGRNLAMRPGLGASFMFRTEQEFGRVPRNSSCA